MRNKAYNDENGDIARLKSELKKTVETNVVISDDKGITVYPLYPTVRIDPRGFIEVYHNEKLSPPQRKNARLIR